MTCKVHVDSQLILECNAYKSMLSPCYIHIYFLQSACLSPLPAARTVGPMTLISGMNVGWQIANLFCILQSKVKVKQEFW